jgi:cytochrome P450
MAKIDLTRLPPGPRCFPLVALRYLRNSESFYASCAARYGDPFRMPSYWGPLVVTGRAEGIRAIFTGPAAQYGIFARTVVEPFLGPTSLMVTSGEQHSRARRALQPRFHGREVSGYGEAMIDITASQLEQWQTGQSVVAQRAMHSITLEIILTVFFAAHEERRPFLREALLRVQSSLGPAIAFLPFLRAKFGGIGPWARFRRAVDALDFIIYEMISDARTADKSGDIMGMLISLRHEDGSQFSDLEIRDQLVSLVYAGHETLAGSLSWALHWIGCDRNILNRLEAEIEGTGVAASPVAIAALPFLDAVCNETLRMAPVVPEVTRQLLAPMDLLGYTLPAGVTLAPSISLAHQDPSVFPEPTKFRPERFLERKYTPFEFLPFGGGTHRCLGASLAMYEMKLVLATIIRNVHFRLASTAPIRASRQGVLLGPREPIVLNVERRVPGSAAANA